MYLKVSAHPNSRKESITKTAEDAYEIAVREPAEKGRANRRIMEMLRNIYPRKKVIIVVGHHSERKVVSIDE